MCVVLTEDMTNVVGQQCYLLIFVLPVKREELEKYSTHFPPISTCYKTFAVNVDIKL